MLVGALLNGRGKCQLSLAETLLISPIEENLHEIKTCTNSVEASMFLPFCENSDFNSTIGTPASNTYILPLFSRPTSPVQLELASLLSPSSPTTSPPRPLLLADAIDFFPHRLQDPPRTLLLSSLLPPTTTTPFISGVHSQAPLTNHLIPNSSE